MLLRGSIACQGLSGILCFEVERKDTLKEKIR
jgi:hypothetical protein